MNTDQKSTYEIRGDVVDPTGGSDLRGTEVGFDLRKNAFGNPVFVWRDRDAQAQVYAAGGLLSVHFYCPQCAGSLMAHSNKKEIRYEKGVVPKVSLTHSDFSHDGRLSISAMRCTYPSCGWHARVVDNVAEAVS